MPYSPSPHPSDTLCFLGLGASHQNDPTSLLESRLRSLLPTAHSFNVQPTKTYVTFASLQTADEVQKKWQRHLPHLSQHPVNITFGQFHPPKTNPEPDDVHADPTTGCPSPDAHLPPGLQLLPFLSEAEEEALLALVDSAEWDTSQVFRRTQHYGAAAIDFKARDLGQDTPVAPIPPLCQALLARARQQQVALGVSWPCGPLATDHFPCMKERDQMTVNEYSPGAGIANHIDVHSLFEDGFLILSLGSAYVMDFKKQGRRREKEEDEEGGAHCSLLLPRRSLLVLQGEARYGWSHGLASRKTDKINGKLVTRGRRVSLSFRRVREGGCECAFLELCDSRGSSISSS